MATKKGSGKIEQIVVKLKHTGITETTTKLGSLQTTLNSVKRVAGELSKKIITLNSGVEDLGKSIASLSTSSKSSIDDIDKLGKKLTKAATAMEKMSAAATGGGLNQTMTAFSTVIGADIAAGLSSMNKQLTASTALLEMMVEEVDKSNKYLYAMTGYLEGVSESTDEAASGISKFNKSIDGTPAKIGKTNNALKNMNREGNKTTHAFSRMAFNFGGPLVAAYASFAATVYTLGQMFTFLKNSADLTRLEKNLGNLATRGQDLRGLSQQISDISAGSLSYEESIRTATKSVTYGFTEEELVKLTEGARKASLALGRDMSESLDRLTLGLAKQEVELLDELGIVTRLEPAMEKYAAQMGKTVKQLSDSERQTALTVEALKQLEDAYGGVTAAANTYEKFLAQLKTTTRDFGAAMAENLNFDLWTSGLQGISSLLGATNKLTKRQQIAADLTAAFTKVRETSNNTSDETLKKAEAEINLLGKYSSAMEEAQAVMKERANLQRTLAEQEAKRALLSGRADSESNKDKTATQRINELRDLNEEIEDTSSKLAEADKQLDNLLALGDGVSKFSVADRVNAIFGNIDAAGAQDKANKLGKVFIGIKESFDKQRDELSSITRGEDNPYSNVLKPLQNVLLEIEAINGDLNSLSQATKQRFDELAKALNIEEAYKRAGGDPNFVINYVKQQGELLRDMSYQTSLLSSGLSSQFMTEAERSRALAGLARDQAEGLDLTNAATKLQLTQQAELLEAEADAAAAVEAHDLALTKISSSYKVQAVFMKDSVKQAELEVEAIKSQISYYIAQGASIEFLKGKYIELYDAKAQASAAKMLQDEQIALSDLNVEYEKKKTFLYEEAEISQLNLDQLQAQVDFAHEHNEDAATLVELFNQQQVALLQHNRLLRDKAEVMASINREGQKELADAKGRISGESNVSQMERELSSLKAEKEAAKTREEKAQLENQIKVLEVELAAAKKEQASKVGGSAGLTSIFGNESLANVGYQASQGNQEAVNAQAASNLEAIKDQLNSLDSEMGMITSGVEGVGQAFYQMTLLAQNGMLNVESAAQGISASLQGVSSILQGVAQENVNSIEAEIAIEKKRDGKSKESMEKIKKLEQQKLKEMQKSKLQQAVMATAAGIAESMSLPWPYNFIQAGIVAAMGAAQIAAIRSSGKSESALLNTEASSEMSLTVGQRDNRVDVSQSASAGELAYLQGASGTGQNANNYTPTPRSSAADMSAGVSYIAGERGPERINLNGSTATMDKETGSSSPSISVPIVIHASGISDQGLRDVLMSQAPVLVEAVESRLAGTGYSLYKR